MNKDIYSLLNSTENQDAEYGERLSDTEVNDIMSKFSERNKIKKSGGGKISKRLMLTLLAAALAAAVIPTSVYAYNRYKAGISKTAKYQNTIVIESTETDDEQSSDADTQLMTYEFGWLPEGFAKPEDDWHYRDDNDAVAPVFYRIPENKNTKIDMPWSADSETYESDGKTAMINYRLSYMNGEKNNYGREIWVSFDGTRYLLCIYITDGISQEDTKKIIDNINLLPTDEVCFSAKLPERHKESNYTSSVSNAVDMDKCDVYHVGDTIHYIEYTTGFNDSYELTVNSAELTDSFDGIHTDSCGWEADFSELMDENGNITENTRYYIKSGDGVDTVNEVIKEEKVPMHILKLNVTFTNKSDAENYIGISPNIIQIDNGNICDIGMLYEKSDEYNKITDSLRHEPGHFFSLDADPAKKGGKNAVILEPGESADVQLAFMVTDNETENLYAYFRMEGNSLKAAMENGKCPVIDLRQ